MKQFTITCLDSGRTTLISSDIPFSGEVKASKIHVDYSGTTVSSYWKWVDFIMSDGTTKRVSVGAESAIDVEIDSDMSIPGELKIIPFATPTEDDVTTIVKFDKKSIVVKYVENAGENADGSHPDVIFQLISDLNTLQEQVDAHEANKLNPHEVTADQVGLGNVDNTADIDKPVSTTQQAALDLKADKTELVQLYRYKGSVATYGSLPVDGLTAGDVYNVVTDTNGETGVNYGWTGTTWDKLGGIVPLATLLQNGLLSKEDFAKIASNYSHTLNTSNPHSVTTTQIGAVNVALGYTQKDTLDGAESLFINDGASKKTTMQKIRDYVDKIVETIVTFNSMVGSTYGTSVVPIDGIAELVQIDGMVLKSDQLLNNPTFDTSYSGWTAGSLGTPTVSGGIVSFTAIAQYGNLYQDTVKQNGGEKVYAICRAKLANSLQKIYINDGVNQSNIEGSSGDGTWRIFSGIRTTDMSSTRTRISFQDNNASSWAEIQVDWIYAFNISKLIYLKQYSPYYSTTFDLLTDAQIKVQMDEWVLNGILPSINMIIASSNQVITSFGKNLFSVNYLVGDTYNTFVSLGNDKFRVTNNGGPAGTINVLPSMRFLVSTQYTFSGKIFELDDSKNARLIIIYTDGTTSTIATPTTNDTSFTFTSTSGKTISFISITYSATGGVTTYSNFQIERGTIASTYKKHRTSSITFTSEPKNIGRVPSGTKDTIESRNSKYYHIKRVMYYELLSTDIVAYTTSLSNVDLVEMNLTSFVGIKSQTTNIDGSFYIPSFPSEITYVNRDETTSIGKFYTNLTRLAFIVAKGTYANLAAAQSAVSGTKLMFELSSPVETLLNIEGNIVQEDVTTITNNGIISSIQISFATNRAKQVEIHSKLLQIVQSQVDAAEAAIGAFIVVSATEFASLTREDGKVYAVYNETSGAISWYYGTIGA